MQSNENNILILIIWFQFVAHYQDMSILLRTLQQPKMSLILAKNFGSNYCNIEISSMAFLLSLLQRLYLVKVTYAIESLEAMSSRYTYKVWLQTLQVSTKKKYMSAC